MCVRTRECVLVCERVLATGGGSLMEWFFYQRHVNAVPREGHQALPKSRKGREREGKGKGEGEGGGGGIGISEAIHRKRVANSVTVFKGSFLGPCEKDRRPKEENKGL